MTTVSAPTTGTTDTAWVRSYYDDVDHMRLEEYLGWHTSDVTVRFGNNPPAHGLAEVRTAIGHFWEIIGGLRHNFVDVWGTPDGTAVVHADIDYTRLDGRVVTTPCVTLLHRVGDSGPVRVDRVQIFVDLAPVFAP